MNTATILRAEQLARVGIFTLVMIVPLLGTLVGSRESVSTAEQRPLAGTPVLPDTLAAWRRLPGEVSAWFDDHFGLREQLIRLNQYLVQAIRLGALSSIPVLEGQGGWLYFTGDRSLEDFQGRLSFSDAGLSAWANALQQRHDWLAARNIPYFFIIVPNKQSIYPEFLPAWLSDQRGETRADQLVQYLGKHTSVPVLDLRPGLLLNKSGTPLYRRYDTHWNMRGADVARRLIIESIFVIDPGLVMGTPAGGTWHEQEVAGGDLARMLGRNDLSELVPRWSTESNCSRNLLKHGPTGITAGKPIVDQCMQTGLDVLIFRDSFMNALRPLLTPHFHRTVYVWKRPDLCLLMQMAAAHAPDLVIEQTTERFLILPPQEDTGCGMRNE